MPVKKARFSQEYLETVKKTLLAKKAKCEDGERKSAEGFKEISQQKRNLRLVDCGDAAAAALLERLILGTLKVYVELKNKIKNALDALERGNYGVCADCDGKISDKRLAAVPWATKCIDCEKSRP